MKPGPSARVQTAADWISVTWRIDALAQQALDSQDAALLCDWPDAASISQAWFDLKYPGRSVQPMLVLDAYLVDAPPFLTQQQRDQVGAWYRSKVSAILRRFRPLPAPPKRSC